MLGEWWTKNFLPLLWWRVRMICGWSQLKNQFMIRVFFVSLNYLRETIYEEELKILKKIPTMKKMHLSCKDASSMDSCCGFWRPKDAERNMLLCELWCMIEQCHKTIQMIIPNTQCEFESKYFFTELFTNRVFTLI